MSASVRIGLGLVLLACRVAFAQQTTFHVGGAVQKPGEWSVSRITSELAPSVQTIRYSMKGTEHTARVIPFWSLVDAARPRIDPDQKNHRVGFAIVVRARDGYVATFSLAELAPDIGNQKVWLALDRDGKALPEKDGPVRLLVPEEAGGHHRRWVLGIQSITLVDGKSVSSSRAGNSR
jgi:DMSO/TMAO reductase YedYZ molybdopterin-dependent catalytic subunit